MPTVFVDPQNIFCRLEDYWIGYKLFCYAYYSHSPAHESEFRSSKLGLFTHSMIWLCVLGLLGFFLLSCIVRLLCDVHMMLCHGWYAQGN